MTELNELIDVLKKTLKQHGITYAVLGRELELSEASIKRMFATQSFSLKRLEEICKVMNMELSDLFQVLEASKHRITNLTEEQEKELVLNPKLFLVVTCVRNNLCFNDIQDTFDITEHELIQLLASLDRLRFIELLPNNLIKLIVNPDFRWLPNGPVETYYAKQVESEYFRCRFNKEHEARLFLTGMVSEDSMVIIKSKLNQLAREFAQLHKQDIASSHKNMNVGLVLAMRPWELNAFTELRK